MTTTTRKSVCRLRSGPREAIAAPRADRSPGPHQQPCGFGPSAAACFRLKNLMNRPGGPTVAELMARIAAPARDTGAVTMAASILEPNIRRTFAFTSI